MGIKKIKSAIQLESMDDDLQNGLWNAFYAIFILPVKGTLHTTRKPPELEALCNAIWRHFYKKPLDNIPPKGGQAIDYIKNNFFRSEWYEVYDFMEFIANMYQSASKRINQFIKACNAVMKSEASGYRFIDTKIAPITDEMEIAEIEEAVAKSSTNALSGVRIHLKSGLEKLSDKKNPDYRNSIKESVSAVESLCKLIAKEPKAELRKVLNIIKDKIEIHVALEQGFKKVYGYTSDDDGIRHALMDKPNLDFEDAKYMLVACSAFVNYLIVKAHKAGIQL